jgi:hypothetical protein
MVSGGFFSRSRAADWLSVRGGYFFYRLFIKEVCLSNVFGTVRRGTLEKPPRGVLYLLNAHDNLQKAHLVTFGSCANIQQRFQPTKGCAQQSLIGVFS